MLGCRQDPRASTLGFRWLSTGYGRLTRRLVQITGFVLVVYAPG